VIRIALGSAIVILAGISGAATKPDSAAVYTAEQAARGKAALVKNAFGTCSDCHAEGLGGRTGSPEERPVLDSLRADVREGLVKNFRGKVPDLVGPAFVKRWENRSVKDLTVNFEKRFASVLDEDTRLSLIAYVLSENGFRAGDVPLTMSTDVPFRQLVGSETP